MFTGSKCFGVCLLWCVVLVLALVCFGAVYSVRRTMRDPQVSAPSHHPPPVPPGPRGRRTRIDVFFLVVTMMMVVATLMVVVAISLFSFLCC